MQQDILPTTRKVFSYAKLVSVDTDAVAEVCASVQKDDLQVSEVGLLSHTDWSDEEFVALITVFNTINFCYWASKDEEKWAIEHRGEWLDGSVGLITALERAILGGRELLNPNYLGNLPKTDLRNDLQGNVEIPPGEKD